MIRYIAWPENFVWPYLHSQGLEIYKNIFYIYPPLYFWLLTDFDKIFGISLTSLQIFSYLIITLTDILIFFAARKKIGPVLIYVLLQLAFEGNSMWPDQLLAPLFAASWLCFQNKKYFLLGIFLGLSLLTKQTAAYFVLGMIVLAKGNKKTLLGTFLVLTCLVLYLLWNQSFRQFWEQTVVYIFSYHARNSLQILWPNKQQSVVLLFIFLPIIFTRKFRLIFLIILASLGIFTRFSYFHLQPALPFLAILIAESKIFFALPALLFFLKVMAANYGMEPKFLTTQILANSKIINQYVPPGEKTLILTSSDQYYFLTKTRPIGNFFTTSTPWNLAYPGIEEKIIRDLSLEKPKYIVFEKGPEKITRFVLKNYRSVLKLTDGASIFEYNPMGL